MLLDRDQINLYNAVQERNVNKALTLIYQVENINFEIVAKEKTISHYLIHKVCQFPEMVPVLKILLQRRANVEVTDHEGKHPLHWAAMFKNLEAAKLLVQYGARAKVIDNFNKKPSDLCFKRFSPDLHSYLLSKECSLFELAALAYDKLPNPKPFIPEILFDQQSKVVLFSQVMEVEKSQNVVNFITPAQESLAERFKQMTI